jgi:hypothetical protein
VYKVSRKKRQDISYFIIRVHDQRQTAIAGSPVDIIFVFILRQYLAKLRHRRRDSRG